MPDVILSNFQPRRREISGVTNAVEAEVTTTADHGYTVDQLVRLIVPEEYGMTLDFVIGKVLTVPTTTTFTVDVDTSALVTYLAPTAPPSFTQSQVVPISGLVDNQTSITG